MELFIVIISALILAILVWILNLYLKVDDLKNKDKKTEFGDLLYIIGKLQIGFMEQKVKFELLIEHLGIEINDDFVLSQSKQEKTKKIVKKK